MLGLEQDFTGRGWRLRGLDMVEGAIRESRSGAGWEIIAGNLLGEEALRTDL